MKLNLKFPLASKSVYTNSNSKKMSVLCSDETQNFFVVYSCVNQVSSYDAYYTNNVHPLEEAHSVHLRCPGNSNTFVENMTKRIRPFFSSSSHLAFPSTSSNNMTSKGSLPEEFYYRTCHSAMVSSAFGRYGHVRSPPRANNRNYTMLLHGIENRWMLFQELLDTDSLTFSRDSSFPPLKSASTYTANGRTVICQNQLYRNSFSINTQRQTANSLSHTTPQLLAPILCKAIVDIPLNHICCNWEMKLNKNLTAIEKCQLMIQLEILRSKHIDCEDHFHKLCHDIVIENDDDCWSRNFFGIRRKKRCNPEMSSMWSILPCWLKQLVSKRWAREGKYECLKQYPFTTSFVSSSPELDTSDIINLSKDLIEQWAKSQ